MTPIPRAKSIADLTARDQRIIELWKEGKVFNEIVARVGHGLTRNAVAGVIHRARQRGWIGQRAQDARYLDMFGQRRNQVPVSTGPSGFEEIQADENTGQSPNEGIFDASNVELAEICVADTGPVSEPTVSGLRELGASVSDVPPAPRSPSPPPPPPSPEAKEIHVVTSLTDQSEHSMDCERYLPATKQLGKPVSILALGPLHCRWVLEERDEELNLPLYCGCRRATGFPYCPPHQARTRNHPLKR